MRFAENAEALLAKSDTDGGLPSPTLTGCWLLTPSRHLPRRSFIRSLKSSL
jgi:hypothetical protein